MALTLAKVLRGVATVVFNASDVAQVTLTNVKDDSFKLVGAEKKVSRELEDGSEIKYDAGVTLQLECTFHELDPTDLGDLKDVDEVVITFSDITKTLTIDSADAIFHNCETAIDGLSTKVVFWVSAAIGTTLGDLFTVA